MRLRKLIIYAQQNRGRTEISNQIAPPISYSVSLKTQRQESHTVLGILETPAHPLEQGNTLLRRGSIITCHLNDR